MGIASEKGFEMERLLPARKNQDNPDYAGLIEQVRWRPLAADVLQTLKDLINWIKKIQ